MAIVKGKIRGGGRQLASYLLSADVNEAIHILDVDGQSGFAENDLRNLLGDFSLNEQLTKSKKGIYHAIYSPTEELAARLTNDQWLTAADVIGKQLGFSEQRRAVVLHQNKAGHRHIHMAFERYSHDLQKMIPIPHNYRKHDKARAILEETFNEQPTIKRNSRRTLIKQELTTLWQDLTDGTEFIKAARQNGYIIAKAYEQGQYVVVDESQGRSFKLVSHLQGVKIKEVRHRLQDRKLIGEKEALAFVATQRAITKQENIIQPGSREDFLADLAKQRSLRKQQTLRPR